MSSILSQVNFDSLYIKELVNKVEGKSVLEFLENGKFELRSKDKRGNSDSQNQTHGQFEITNSGIFLKLTPNDVNDKGEIVREYLHESPHACKANGSNPYLLDCNFDLENLDWIFQFDILIEKLSRNCIKSI